MGGGGNQTTKQTSTPWEGQQPYLEDLFQQAQGLYQGGPQQYYPGQTVAPFSPQTMMAMDMMTNRAMSGSPQMDAMGGYLNSQLGQQNFNPFDIAGMNAGMMGGGSGGFGESQPGSLPSSAGAQLSQTASGQYLGSNPYLDQMYDTAAGRAGEAFNEQVMPGIAAQFGAGGRTGSGIHQQVAGNAARQFGRDLQGMAADIYAPAYESERNRQIQAAQGGGQLGLGYMGNMTDLYGNVAQNQFRAGTLVPGYNDMQYGDIQRLMGVGGMVEDQAQRYMGANQDRWNFGQQAPWQNLGNYANTIYGLPGGYGTQKSSVPGGSRMQGAMGGAMAGWGMTGSPWGVLGGGVLGGLL